MSGMCLIRGVCPDEVIFVGVTYVSLPLGCVLCVGCGLCPILVMCSFRGICLVRVMCLIC